MAVGFTYSGEVDCPVCSKKFNVTKTRSRLIKTSQDSDFCVHYKDFNPYYYTVWICPHCGYAADEKFFNKLKETDKAKIAQFLSKKEVKIKHSELRTREEAIVAFKLAVYFAELINAPASRLGSLYLKLAWMYREAGDAAKEQEMLPRALEHYDRSLTTERYPIGSMTDNAAMYLIAALYARIGNADTATQYLSRVIGDRRARLEPAIYNLARDLWQELRNEKAPEK